MTVLFGACVALPLLLPLPGLESVPPLAQGIAIASILFVAAQAGSDAARARPGGGLRLVVYLYVIAALASFGAGGVFYGLNASATVSLLNWIALGGLVVAAQVLLVSVRDVDRVLDLFARSYVVLSVAILIFLFGRFGAQIFDSSNRGPFQVAVRGVMPAWPNYYGVAAAVAITIIYGRLLTGPQRRAGAWQLVVLLVVLLATFSRGALLACVSGLGVMTVSSGRFRRAMPLFLASSLVVLLVAFLLPGVRYQFVATFTPGTSQNVGVFERLAFAAEAVRVWSAHPIVGIGFHQFLELAHSARITNDGGSAAALGSVHNEYVTTLLKGGLLVMTSFVALLWAALRLFRQLRHSSNQDLRRLGVVGLGMATVLLVAGLTLESLRTLLVSAPFWALVGGVDAIRLRSYVMPFGGSYTTPNPLPSSPRR